MRRVRRAVRALVLDEDDRVLLTRYDFDDRQVWAGPGGGIEPGEHEPDALRRELREELGLEEVELGPAIWVRDDRLPGPPGADPDYDAQVETYYLVRVEAFDAEARVVPELYMKAARWWTLEELSETREIVAPRRLAELVAELLEDGPPASPIDAGV
jgi:ADP-ribose pyrophosphatase YjhB (NUDIX family)